MQRDFQHRNTKYTYLPSYTEAYWPS